MFGAWGGGGGRGGHTLAHFVDIVILNVQSKCVCLISTAAADATYSLDVVLW